MNTEAMNTLKQVRVVISILQKEISDPTYTKNEKILIGNVLVNLNKLEDIVINSILQEMVDKINSANAELKKLISDMEESTERIAKFSKTVGKISNVVGVLADITAKAISVGIL